MSGRLRSRSRTRPGWGPLIPRHRLHQRVVYRIEKQKRRDAIIIGRLKEGRGDGEVDRPGHLALRLRRAIGDVQAANQPEIRLTRHSKRHGVGRVADMIYPPCEAKNRAANTEQEDNECPSRLEGCQTRLRSCGLDRNRTALQARAMGIHSLCRRRRKPSVMRCLLL